jgi:hypothetical protein
MSATASLEQLGAEMDLMRRPGARLIKTHTSNGGCAHYVARADMSNRKLPSR